jgi:IS30 family transposase
MAERKVIFFQQMVGKTLAEIGGSLGRNRGTISRELRRNVSDGGQYLWDLADGLARARQRGKVHHPVTGDDGLMAYVSERLERRWSPEQIAGRLKEAEAERQEVFGKKISHQTIYRWIWSDRQRSDRFRPFLRIGWRKRRKPYGKPSRQGQIPNRVMIDRRPAIVAARTRLGDWEADTMVGKGRRGNVVTCVERSSRYLVARKVARATAKAVNGSLHGAMRRLPGEKRKTLTVDNGREFARHEKLSSLLQWSVYFAHPYHAWERGTNENTNGLLRQYIPKRMDLLQLTPWDLETYVNALNNRPRKCLNYRTPAEVFWSRSVALRM